MFTICNNITTLCCDENKLIDCKEHVNRRRMVAVRNYIFSVLLVVLLLTYKTQYRTKIKIIDQILRFC
jgi:hypothetical protein